jgi:UDP-N-acetylglucosamine--N-acetylmuramyl-(pentapeptide) pyrophosphoryl-undecaprenol N-acetylglucosamine transferase
VLLVFGGSQGAQRVNRAVAGAAADLAAAGVQVLHAAGAAQADAVRAEVGDVSSHVVLPYVDRMDLAYAAADLALCRAGAMTCAELAAVGLPAVYVPLPIGNGEQALNARPVVQAGGGLLADDAALTPQRVREQVLPLLRDGARLEAMSRAAARHGARDADAALAELVHEAARGGRG